MPGFKIIFHTTKNPSHIASKANLKDRFKTFPVTCDENKLNTFLAYEV